MAHFGLKSLRARRRVGRGDREGKVKSKQTQWGGEKSVVQGREISPGLRKQILIEAQKCVCVRISNANVPTLHVRKVGREDRICSFTQTAAKGLNHEIVEGFQLYAQ